MSVRGYLFGALALATLGTGRGTAAAASLVDQRALFEAVGAMYQIDPDLLAAIAKAESGGRADTLSPKGARGMMQLMPATARRFHVSDPFDPIDNVLGAARFIAFLRDRHGYAGFDPSRLPEVLAAYNAGEGAVDSYCGVPPYRETRYYVRKVLWLYFAGSVPSRDAAPELSERTPSRMRAKHRITDLSLLEHLSKIRSARAAAELSPHAEVFQAGSD